MSGQRRRAGPAEAGSESCSGWAWGAPRTGDAGQERPRELRPARGAEGSGGGHREGTARSPRAPSPITRGSPGEPDPGVGLKVIPNRSPAPQVSRAAGAPLLPPLYLSSRQPPGSRTACPGVGPQANRLWLFRRDLLAHRGSWRGKTNRLTWPGRSR